MDKIIGIDTAYAAAVRSRGRNMLISANLVAELIERIGQLEEENKQMESELDQIRINGDC